MQPPAPSGTPQVVQATPAPETPAASAQPPAEPSVKRKPRLAPPPPPPRLPLLEIPRLDPPRRVAVGAVEIEPQVVEPQSIPSLEIRPIDVDRADEPVGH
jgi:hypothetical protein